MRKFEVIYPSFIAGKIRKSGEILELGDNTDKNFIKRLLTIKAIKEIKSDNSDGDDAQEPKAKAANKQAKATAQKQTTKRSDD